jgi:hypothetical protein
LTDDDGAVILYVRTLTQSVTSKLEAAGYHLAISKQAPVPLLSLSAPFSGESGLLDLRTELHEVRVSLTGEILETE